MILGVGLTPAWQQILVFDSLRVGEVNRAREAHWCASGKVVNLGLAIHRLGAPCLTLTVIGGPQGESMEKEFDVLGIPRRLLSLQRPTRTCTTIVDHSTGMITELVENAAPVQPDELEKFRQVYEDEVRHAGVVVLIGSLPAGTPRTFYRELMAKTSSPVVVDASGPELLEILPLRPFCVKPNREELGKTVGRTLNTDVELRQAMAEINSLGAEWVVVSEGGKPLRASTAGRAYLFRPPKIDVVNPIGSGDCLAAGIAVGVSRKMDIPDAIRLGIAAAADNATMLLPARLDPNRVNALLAGISKEKL